MFFNKKKSGGGDSPAEPLATTIAPIAPLPVPAGSPPQAKSRVEAPQLPQAARVDAAPVPDPQMNQRVAEARTRIHAAVGQIVVTLAAVPRYRHQTLGDLQSLILDPLMRDRVAIASAKPVDGAAHVEAQFAGIALWATVSEEVDAKIRDQVRSGVFPVKLKSADWVSGDRVWLLDVIAPSQKMASAVLANFNQVVKKPGEVRIHPVVARMVDPELLKKMGAVADGPVTAAKN